MIVKVKKLNPNARIPTQAHDKDFCYDVYATSCEEIEPHIWKYGLGLAFEIKRDFELLSNLGGNLNRQAMNIFRKYQINDGAVEEHDSEEPFMMDIDGDGIYLLKRID